MRKDPIDGGKIEMNEFCCEKMKQVVGDGDVKKEETGKFMMYGYDVPDANYFVHFCPFCGQQLAG